MSVPLTRRIIGLGRGRMLGELRQASGDEGELIEEAPIEAGVKELVLIVEWLRPLHVVVVVDDIREEERIVTVYEPDEDRWSPDFKVRIR